MSARQPTNAKHRHRVVVVGGGFGGLLAAKLLRKGDVEVTVVDRTNHHLFQPPTPPTKELPSERGGRDPSSAVCKQAPF